MLKQNIIAYLKKDKMKAIFIFLLVLLLLALPLLPVPVSILRGSTFIGLLMPLLFNLIVYYLQTMNEPKKDRFFPNKRFLFSILGVEAVYFVIFVIIRLIQYNPGAELAVYVAASIICFSISMFVSNVLWILGTGNGLLWAICPALLLMDNIFSQADKSINGSSWFGGFISSFDIFHNIGGNVVIGIGMMILGIVINYFILKTMIGKPINNFMYKIINEQK